MRLSAVRMPIVTVNRRSLRTPGATDVDVEREFKRPPDEGSLL
jgi:hypothetical protein